MAKATVPSTVKSAGELPPDGEDPPEEEPPVEEPPEEPPPEEEPPEEPEPPPDEGGARRQPPGPAPPRADAFERVATTWTGPDPLEVKVAFP